MLVRFFSSYIRDLTHVRPMHPETLQFLLRASGFERVEIRYRSPLPDHEDEDHRRPTTSPAGPGIRRPERSARWPRPSTPNAAPQQAAVRLHGLRGIGTELIARAAR